ncbi:hypothetical protein SDC9_114554 [bioreactor metagenome]|uniref:DUF4342 domain-containing protein n=1 Tax=bioreactor metagenome TaxID=1076179 RepID=A0A645BQB5_9ZZZZ
MSYEEAKAALEICNDDLVEALVYLERQKKINTNTCYGEETSFGTKVKELIKKGNNTKFMVKKKEDVVLSMPVTGATIITVIAPYVTVGGLLVAFFTGHRVKFQGKNGECTGVNSVFDKVANTVDNVKKDFTEEKNHREETNKESNI